MPDRDRSLHDRVAVSNVVGADLVHTSPHCTAIAIVSEEVERKRRPTDAIAHCADIPAGVKKSVGREAREVSAGNGVGYAAEGVRGMRLRV